VVYGIGADKRIETPTDALVGGYPHLVTSMRELPSWSQRARFALAPPS
jgi:hypothetical protein